jgi:acetolactate synthase small subunit
MTQIEINLNIVNLRSLQATLKIMHLTALKKDSQGYYTKLLESSLNDIKKALNCIIELEKVLRSNETLISSYQIALMRVDKQLEEARQENKNLIELL